MSKNIYVGNLPYNVSQDDLTDLFGRFGEIKSVSVISDKFTGRSKGFGFVEMSTDSEAEQAIQSLHGADLQGRKITVNEARPREQSFGGGGGGGREGGGRRSEKW